MTSTRTSPRALALLLGLLLLTGCGAADGDDRAADPRDRRRAPTSEPGAPAPTPSAPSSSASSPSAAPSSAPPATRSGRPSGRRTLAEPTRPQRPRSNALTVRAAGPDGHLIRATDLGGRWRVRATSDEDGRVMSPCHRASMADIGAERTRVRDFRGPGTAVQAVSRFVDHRSAWRIERVVEAWTEDCARRLERRDAALGAVRHGRWLAVVEVADVRHPQRRLATALAAAAATF